MTQERYFIGPGLRDKLRETITRVDGLMGSESGANVPTVVQDLPRRGGGQTFRICTFAGAWPIGSSKTVTFKNQTATPNTVSATNLFWPIPDGSQRDCSVAKDGTAWYLLVPQLYAAEAATAATITTAALEFNTLPVVALATASTNKFSITPVAVDAITGVTLGSDSLSFTRKSIGVFFESTSGTVAVSVTTCSTAAG